jgi:transcriptional regulator with XRE-family HTH domain
MEVRAASGKSQRELASALDVPHSWVAKVESGERRIDLLEFAWFCAACGRSPSREAGNLLQHWLPTSGDGRTRAKRGRP